MTKFHTLLTSAALIGFAALPAVALNLNKDNVHVMLGHHNGKVAQAIKDKVAADAADGSIDDGPGDGVIDATSKFVGNTVVTKDGTTIGTVQKVMITTTGENMVYVTIDAPEGANVDSFILAIDPKTQADGSINLGWTADELKAQLQAQAAASN
jgi:hypothetical protein